MLFSKLFRLFLCGTVLAALSFPVCAQQIKWSAPIGDDNQMKYLKIIGSDEDDFYILRSNQPFGDRQKNSKSRKYRLASFSQAMALKWEKPLLPPTGEGRILDVQMVNHRLLVSSSMQNGQSFRLALQYMNAAGDVQGSPVAVDEWTSGKFDDESRPDLLLSNDQALVGLAYRLSDRSKSKQQFRIVMCDTNLAVQYKKEISVDAGSFEFVPVDMAVSNAGNLFLLGALTPTDKKGKKAGESHYRLYAWWRQGDSLTIHEISKTGIWLTDAALAGDNVSRSVVVAGFYSNSRAAASAGVFYYRVLADSSEPEVKLASFSEDYLKRVKGNKADSGKELLNYSIDRLLLRRDGGAVLSAESYNTTSRSYYDYYTQMLISHTYYSFGNILTLSVNPDGSMHWSEVLNKEHNSVDDEGYVSSYCSAVYRAKMYYIYNKYIDDKTSVMLTSVSNQGEQKTMVLFNEVEHVVAVPRAARQIEEDVLLLPAFKENKLCIARIGF